MLALEKLGYQIGVHFEEDMKALISQNVSVEDIIRGNVTSDFAPIVGKLYIGETQFQDMPAELLHSLAEGRNSDLGALAYGLAHAVQNMDDNTRYFLQKHYRQRFEKRDMAAPMPDEWYQHWHHALFYDATSLRSKSSSSYQYTENSRILAFWIPTLAVYKFITENIAIKDYNSRSATARDYLDWKDFVLSSKAPFSKFFSKSLSAYIDFEAFKEHGYVLGATKAGKTEFLKVIAHHVITNEMPNNSRAGGIIIDPHGDFSREVACFKECCFNRKVILFDPSLYPDKTPSINIFHVPNEDEKTIEVFAEQLVEAFDEIIADSSLSTNMRAILLPCISVLLRRKGSSIADLQRFMQSENAQDLIEIGKNLPVNGQADFFRNGFENKKYEPTKNAIYTRLQILQNSRAFNRLVNPSATLDIEHLLNAGYFIIMNLSRGAMSESISSAFGRLVMAQVKSIGLRRESIPKRERPSSYIFIDECQNYISESIEKTLTELRKYGVHLILANQVIGQNMSAQLTKIILGNTGVKVTGKNGHATNTAMARELGIDIEELNKLTTGRFCAHVKQKQPTKPFIFSAPTHCLGFKNYMGEEAWKEQKEYGWQGYIENSVLDSLESPSDGREGLAGHTTTSEGGDEQKYNAKFKF